MSIIIHQMVTECDSTGKKYLKPVLGYAVLAQGAIGRWCQVLHIGPEEGERLGMDKTVMSYEDAVATASLAGTVDF